MTLASANEPTGSRQESRLPGLSGVRRGKGFRTHNQRRAARGSWEKTVVHKKRGVAPNDPKLSDSPARRDRCTAGGKAEAGSSGRDAQASSLERMVRRFVRIESPPQSEWDAVALENSKSVEELATGQSLVDAPHDGVPCERLEEGMPVRWADESVRTPGTPDGDDSASKTSGGGAIL